MLMSWLVCEGMLSNSEGEMVALWANYNEQKGSDDMQEYCRGLPLAIIKPWLDKVPTHPCLDIVWNDKLYIIIIIHSFSKVDY